MNEYMNAILQQNQIACCNQSMQQSIRLDTFAFGLQQTKPEMLAKLVWSQQGRCVGEENTDPDYEAAIQELDKEYPGLRNFGGQV